MNRAVDTHHAEELLRLEGFSEIDYVEIDQGTTPDLLLANKADLTVHVPPALLPDLDVGKPLIALAGLHGGCYELFANERVRAIRDLKGKRVAVNSLGGTEYYFIAAMVAYVGMNPRQDIEWVDAQSYDAMMPSFIDGQADAVLAFPPHPQYLRAKPANTSFTYVGNYADSRMACQFIAWQLARGFENMKPSAGEA